MNYDEINYGEKIETFKLMIENQNDDIALITYKELIGMKKKLLIYLIKKIKLFLNLLIIKLIMIEI